MHPLLKRILVNGFLTAAVLAVVGYMFAELAGLWLSTSTPSRESLEPAVAAANDPLSETLQYRVPVTMALWGLVFVAVGETILHLWRSRRKPQPLPEPKLDTATILLEEILAKVEAERATPASAAHTSAPIPQQSEPSNRI